MQAASIKLQTGECMPIRICRPGLVLLLGLLLAACSRPAPEQQLRESMTALQAALDARDADGVEQWLAEDFIGPDGLDREGATRLARLSFLRYRNVGITLGPLQVEIQGSHARVNFSAALSGGSGGLPESARLYQVETGWRMEDGEWRMTSARWESRL